MADGGEGTADVICNALGGSWVKCKAHDPFGREIDARYAWIANGKLAVMEMSEAAGMRRLSESERDPLLANTFGVGEMILIAAQNGAREIIVGLGGSATNDGGFGMARALGFRFFSEKRTDEEKKRELTARWVDLQKLERIEKPKEFVGCRKLLRQLMSEIRCSAKTVRREFSVRRKARLTDQDRHLGTCARQTR